MISSTRFIRMGKIWGAAVGNCPAPADVKQQSGSGAGLGLSLHICMTSTERLTVAAGVELAPGEGSTFWFTLSLALPMG